MITIRTFGRSVSARRVAAVVLLGTAALAINLQPEPLKVASAGAATGPTLTVSPSTNLVNQAVTVSWTNFAVPTQFGSNFVAIYQCKANPVSVLADCYGANAFPSSEGGNRILTGITGDDLSGSANFEVRNSAQLPELGCDDKTPCSIVAFDANTPVPASGLPDGAVVAPISFARTNTSCPIPLEFDAVSGGEASIAQQLYRWAATKCTGTEPLSIDFTESSSTNAREIMIAGENDLAFTSLPATEAELAEGKDTESIDYVPVSLNAAVFAFNIIDSRTRQQITDLTLSPRLVTRLITDSQLLGFFQDPEFLALNPGHNWPDGGASQPILRAERNADTHIATDWMYANADSKSLLAGKDIHGVRVMPDFRDKVYPVENFETALSDDGFVPHTGELDGARRLFYKARPDGQQFSTQGYIGLISRSNAIRFGVPMAKLVNRAGNAIAPDQAGMLAGLAAMKNVNGVLTPDVTSTAPNAYPLTKVDYAMVRTSVFSKDANGTKTSDPAKATSLARLLSFAVGAGQQDLAVGYLPLPTTLVARANTVIAKIKPLEGTNTTTTTRPGTSTTVTGATTPTTAGLGFDSGVDTSGGSSCCDTGTTPQFGSVDSPSPTPTPPASGNNGAAPLRYALTAPDWVPIASIGPATTNMALPFLLGIGAIAALVTCAWPLAPRLAKLRSRVVGSGSAS